jgi:hypothetical protein
MYIDIKSLLEMKNFQILHDLIKCEDISNYYMELKIFHLSMWRELNTPIRIKNSFYAYSCLTFFIYSKLETKFIDYDDDIKLSDFPRIIIKDTWIHDTFNSPISHMTQQMIVDLLNGYLWHLCSDIEFINRDKDWVNDMKTLLHLIENRIYSIMHTRFVGVDIINMTRYQTTTPIVHEKIDENDITNYDSDEDNNQFKKTRLDLEDDIKTCSNSGVGISSDMYPTEDTKNISVYSEVNTDFIFDMDSIISYLHQCWINHNQYTNYIKHDGYLDLKPFRQHLLKLIKPHNATAIVKGKNLWMDEFKITPAHIRQHSRKNKLFGKQVPSTKQILFGISDVSMSNIKKLEDVLPINNSTDVIRSNTDFTFFYISTQFDPGVCKVVYCKDPMKISENKIYRDRILNVWILYINSNERYSCTSFTYAFRLLRLLMIEKNIPPIIEHIKVDIYDEYF